MYRIKKLEKWPRPNKRAVEMMMMMMSRARHLNGKVKI
jgi:hypothetical protein